MNDIERLQLQGDCARRVLLWDEAIQLVPRSENPKLWALLKCQLGGDLAQNPSGDRANNIEIAIEHFSRALEVLSHHLFPEDWAMTHHNLGTAYRMRILGQPAENIERVIEHQRLALRVYTLDEYPEEWARTQDKLAAAFQHRINGERAENIENAIAHLRNCLRVYSLDNSHRDYFAILNRLAIAYRERIKGDPAANLELAIEFCQTGIEQLDPADLPEQWVHLQINLGNAYTYRIRGDSKENARSAIRHYEDALALCRSQNLPHLAAGIVSNIANAQTAQRTSNSVEDSEIALERALQALSVHSGEQSSEELATIHITLAKILGFRNKGDPSDNIERAIGHCHEAVSLFNSERYPEQWAAVHNNLGILYQIRRVGSNTDNCELAVGHYEQARSLYERYYVADSYRKTSITLGDLLFGLGRWAAAAQAYSDGVKAAELQYQTALTPEARHQQWEDISGIPARYAYALCRVALLETSPNGMDLRAAVEVLERGRTRMLAEMLALDLAPVDRLKPEDQEAFVRLRGVIQSLQAELRARENEFTSKQYLVTCREAQEAYSTLERLVTRIHSYLPEFLPASRFEMLRRIAKERTLVYLCVTSAGGLALIVDGDSVEAVLLTFDESDLRDILSGDSDNGGYIAGQLGDRRALHSALVSKFDTVGTDLVRPVVDRLMCRNLREFPPENGYPSPRSVILIPTGRLGLLPLHAAMYSREGRTLCLLDEHAFDLSFAPAAQALDRPLNEGVRLSTLRLCAVGNPLPHAQPLAYAAMEAVAVASLYPTEQRHLLIGNDATKLALKQALSGAGVAHFSCHGSFNGRHPLESGLDFGDGALTLREILAQSTWCGIRIVVLSACQTGISEFRDTPDEALGLPAGFLQAGVNGVVASLWPVSDLSTALLMTKFYELLMASPKSQRNCPSVAGALGRAQCWLRDATGEELTVYLREHMNAWNATGSVGETVQKAISRLTAMPRSYRPFEEPYFWAAFQLVGR